MTWNAVAVLTGDQGATGAQGPTGSTGSQGAQGSTGSQGPTGNTGSTGPAGADGKTVLNGAGAPSGGTGANGDFYVDTTASRLYGPKTAGAWGSGVSIVGPQGVQGVTGSTGSQGPTGSTGSTGPAGADGADGATGATGPGVPTGGATGTLLAKTSATNFATAWSTPASLGLELTANKGVANGYCGLASNSAVAINNLPGASSTPGYGIIQLAGDLAGTAAAPTVPGLANKAPLVHAANHAYGGSDVLPVVLFQGRATTQPANMTINTLTVVALDSEDVDSHNGHSLVTNTSRFVCPIAGWYEVSTEVPFTGVTSGLREVFLLRNGVQIPGCHALLTATAAAIMSLTIPRVLAYCAVNDYIEVAVKTSVACSTFGNATDGTLLTIASRRLGVQ